MDKTLKENNKNLPKSLCKFKSIILTYSLKYYVIIVSSGSIRPVNLIK